jgi:hypothetical protein
MILLDWTRMGKTYCIAGVIVEDLDLRIVRPLRVDFRDAPVRNVGWSPYLLDCHVRWEIFELVGPAPAPPQPPHLEDVWVRSLRPRRALASAAQRRTILAATAAATTRSLFGEGLTATRTGAHLTPGVGQRSLATVLVPARTVSFSASWRDGAAEPDFRVQLPVPGLGERLLAVKDHHLLLRAREAGADLDRQTALLDRFVHGLGDQVAVRLGLSRPFQHTDGQSGEAACWLMADGFFSLSDPQS